MKKYLLGIDIGTSACKATVFDIDGNVIATDSGKYNVIHTKPGWAEQHPYQWWTVLCKTLKRLWLKVSPDDIAGIGVDGQSWSAIPVNKYGDVLFNTPIWYDTRSADICENLKNTIGEDEIFNVCGNPVQPTYASPKMIWFRNLPDTYRETYKFLQSNSFIVYKLTEKFTQDISQCYGFHFFDMRNGCWNHDLADRMGIDIGKLPDIYNCHDVVGEVTAIAAEYTGLTVGTPVVAGGLDAACGTLGVGIISDGETQEHGGTSGGMSCCIDTYHADKRLILCRHVVPHKWLLQGGTVGGGGVYKWFEQNFGHHERMLAEINNTSSFYELDKIASKINAGSDGVIFLPYMAGERSPIWDIHAKGVFYGLDYTKTKAHMARACMEGAVFSLLHNLDVAESCGVVIDELRSMGGSANSRLWTQMKSDITGKRITVPSADTATTLGAAILAGVGIGMYNDFDDAVKHTIRIQRIHEPNIELYEVYNKNYKIYLELYESLKHVMRMETGADK